MRPLCPRHRAAESSSKMISDKDLSVVKEGEEEEERRAAEGSGEREEGRGDDI